MRDNRARRRAGRVLVDGWRETWQALQAGWKPLGVYVAGDPTQVDWDPTKANGDADWDTEQRRVIDAAGDRLVVVTDRVMEKIAYGQSARGVIAEFDAPESDLSQLSVPESGLILILDQFEKPGNIGASFRCADAAGVDAVLLTPKQSDRFNPNAIRSSLGAVFTVPSAAADEQDVRRWLSQRGYRIIAARVESSQPLWETALTGPLAVVIGSEAHGLGARWTDSPDSPVQAVRIPMAGQVDSLNASVSAATILFEAARQRQVSQP